jgi:hypothetical protein
MEKNAITLDPKIDESVESYLTSKSEGDMIDLRIRCRVVSIDEDMVRANIEEILRLPEWKTGKPKEDKKTEIEEKDSAVVRVLGSTGSEDEYVW